MNDKKKSLEQNLSELRKRSQTGFLKGIKEKVEPIRSTVKETTDAELKEILDSIFND